MEKGKDTNEFDPWGKSCLDLTERLLIEGPRRRLDDIIRILKLMWEFLKGFHVLRNVGPCVTFFGSARFGPRHRYYALARETAKLVSHSGFTIMTGGGPGIMEAANRGAKDNGGQSVGCNIILPKEQSPNGYLDRFVEFHHFYVRKVMLLRYSYAFVVLPGGYGTMDEIFETITLIQTHKINKFPIVVMGLDFWLPLRELIEEGFVKDGTISQRDSKLLFYTDDPKEAASFVLKHSKDGLKRAHMHRLKK